jgi:hypothetical protein
MAKKVPVIVYVDPEVESQFTIKPFAARLAIKPQAAAGQFPQEMTSTAIATATVNNDVDADVDVD